MDAIAKAPRGVRKQQLKNGTAGPVHRKVDPLAKLSSHGGHGTDKPGASGSGGEFYMYIQ